MLSASPPLTDSDRVGPPKAGNNHPPRWFLFREAPHTGERFERSADERAGALIERNKDMPVAAPRWEWKWNPNTILFLIAIAGGVLSWGYAVARWEGALKELTNRMVELETRTATFEADGRARTRLLDNHELRLGTVEKQATDSATAMRAVEATLNALATEVRVSREILQRMEASQGNRRNP